MHRFFHQITTSNRQKGFTLVEVMTAVLITVLGLVGIYSLVVRTMNVAVSNTDRFVAAQLAKEGIELVRNIRDRNVLAGESDWALGLGACSGVGCEMDYNDSGLAVFSGGGRNFYIDSNGFYNYDASGQKTKYKRKIVIDASIADVLDILVEITGGAGSQPFRAYSKLYNWRK